MELFRVDAFHIFDKQWGRRLPLGTLNHYNTMTISWGGTGNFMLSRPVATVYVKPIRYTYQFLEENEVFYCQLFSRGI